MPLVKCVHCDTENDAVETAGYCDECGKKLPGIYTPPKSAFPHRDESDASETKSSNARQAGNDSLLPIIGTIIVVWNCLALLLFLVALIIPDLRALNNGLAALALLIDALVAVLFGIIVSLRGAFASREQLLGMSAWIGTKNPTVARIACWVFLALILSMASFAGVAAFAAFWK